jgi:hypothetical protein
MLKVIEKQASMEANEELLPLDEIAREGARRMLIEALKVEADDYVERHRGERDEVRTRAAGGAQRSGPRAQAYPGSGDGGA